MSGPLVKPKKSNNGASPLRRTPVLRGSGGQRPGGGHRPHSSNNNNVFAPASSSSTETSDQGVNYTDFRLRSCTKDEVKDLRHHILKFHSKSEVNPAKQFTQPIRFHRKDPKNLQYQLTLSEMEERKKEGEQDDKDKANKPEQNKADMSLVAPDGGARRPNRPFQKKTRQVMAGDEATRRLRYEEYYPWVMEDFEGHNTWVGSYEAAQSDCYVLFVFDVDGFKMVPAEKYYKMTPRNKFNTLSLEEAEQRMEKKQAAPRWIMKHIAQEQEASGKQVNMRRRFRTVDNSSDPALPTQRRRGEDDRDEIDFDEEFADDEEAPIMDGNEEDLKEVEEKIKKEQRSANHVGPSNENEPAYDDEDAKIDKEGRKLKKYLRSLEKNTNYESDDDENPYLSEEEDSDDDIFNEREEPKVKKEEGSSPSIKQEPDADSDLSLSRPIVKKEYKNLPRGMVILQLAPRTLANFPRDVWNPNAKRRREDSEGAENASSKKIKLERSASPPAPAAAPAKSKSPSPPVVASTDTKDPSLLLTEEDVKNVIRQKRVTAKELLGELKPKLKRHPDNPSRLKELVRKVARLHEGALVLKE
jgi:transcription initiation factor TFIIF subunit alpha